MLIGPISDPEQTQQLIIVFYMPLYITHKLVYL